MQLAPATIVRVPEQLQVSILFIKNRDLDEKIVFKNFSKRLFKYSHHLL